MIQPHQRHNNNRLIIVFRFVVGIGERASCILLIQYEAEIELPMNVVMKSNDARQFFTPLRTTGSLRLDVRNIKIIAKQSGPHGQNIPTVPPCTGILSNEDFYAVYRFLIFIDRFGLTTDYRKETYEAIYNQPLGISPTNRIDSSSSQIITIILTGGSLRHVMKRLLIDILIGMVQGKFNFNAD